MKKITNLTILLLLICSNYVFAVDDCIVNTKSESVILILTKHTVVYTEPKLCKPLPMADFSAIKAANNWDYSLNWSKGDHDLWNVDKYEVRVDGTDITTYDFDQQLPLNIDLNVGTSGNKLHQFEVRACASVATDDPLNPLVSCGDWQSTDTQCSVACVDGSLTAPGLGGPFISTTGNYTLSWFGSFDSFELQEKVTLPANNNYITVFDNTNTQMDFNKPNGTAFTYRIRGHNGNVYSPYSNEKLVDIRYLPTIPSITNPQNNTIITTDNYLVSWAQSTYATRYEVNETIGGISNVYHINNSTTTLMSFDNRVNGSYSYQIYACNGSDSLSCSFSSVVTVTIDIPTPATPNIVIPSGINTSGSYDIEWNTVANATNYILTETINGQSTPYTINNNIYSFNGKASGTYTYQVKACNGSVCSDNSSSGQVVVVRPANLITESEHPFLGANTNGNLLLELIDLPPAPDSSTIVGATKGSFSVSPNGAANYSIPILTAPGSGGLVPNVSINYNSQSSRSALGKGWSVSGYSVVSRCGQTFAQDSSSGAPLVLGVNFSNTDKFCVNGKRLFLATGTSYGAEGATYATEINDFTRYTSYGNSDGSPQCFVAEYKNGSKTYYGDCNTSLNDNSSFVDAGLGTQSDPNAQGKALMWAQSRQVDNKGNYYDNHYRSSIINDTVEFYLDGIKYTSNQDLTNQTLRGEIKLIYVDSSPSQITTSVISNSPFVKSYDNNKQLESITSSYNGQIIRHYKLNYENTDAAGFDLLTSIEECDTDDQTTAVCLLPTDFTWGNTLASDKVDLIVSSGANPVGLPSIPTGEQIIAGKFDANNDGFEDYYYSANNQLKVGISKANGTGFYLLDGPAIGGINHNIGVKIADINADGFPDFIYLNNVYLWKGEVRDEEGKVISLTYDTVDFSTVFGNSSYSQELYDFNGDGLVDILNFNSASASTEEPTLTIYTNRYDLSHDDEAINHNDLIAAFNHQDSPAIPIDFKVKQFYKYDIDTNPIDIFIDNRVKISDFEQITIKQVVDINSDGVPELILDVDVLLDCPTTGVEFNCNDTPYINLKAIAYLNNDNTYNIQHLAGGSSCTACKEQIMQERFVDVTGDGQPELCYVNLLTTYSPTTTIMDGWKCHSELGDKTTTSILDLNTILNVPPNATSDVTLDYIEFTDYQDLDGDGYLDFMHSYGDNWYWARTRWNNGTMVLDAWKKIPNFVAGNSDPGNPSYPNYVDINLFLDINHDGMIDHLNFDVTGSDTNGGLLVGLHQTIGDPLVASPNKEKIININNAFGHNIDINYQPMSNPDVYTPSNNSGNEWFGGNNNGRLSPVYDFNSSMSLVASYQSDMPASMLTGTAISGASEFKADFNQSYQYEYFHGKLQAGGRGFLGFGKVNIYDANKEILTETSYHQNFPYTGQAANVTTSHLVNTNPDMLRAARGGFSSTPCWVDNSCTSGIPEIDVCLTKDGIICETLNRSAIPAGDRITLSSAATAWNHKTVPVGDKTSYFAYPENITTDQYEPTGDRIGRILVNTDYQEQEISFYGNPTTITTYSYDFNEITDTSNGVQEATLVKTNSLTYNYEIGTNSITGQDEYIVNNIKSNDETLQRPDDSRSRITTYEYDNKYRLLKSEEITHNGKTLLKNYDSRDIFGNSKKVIITTSESPLINRNTEKEFDTDGRYIKSQKIAGEVEQTVISRNKFGSPTETMNKQGVSTYYRYDNFGKLYYQIDELGQFSQTTYSTSVCATGSAYAVTTESAGPTVQTCFDKLGREIRTTTEGFTFGSTVYVDSQYDTAGRVFAKSIPMFSVPDITQANQWQRFQYDDIGRVGLSRNAKGEETTTEYGPLQVIITNARGAQTTTNSNILGEVKDVTDHENNTTTYKYDARGNQISIDGPLTGKADEIITEYDDFDQVKKIIDPDLGEWTYKYNLFGELEYQRDTKLNCTVMTYDDLGRMTSRKYWTEGDEDCISGSNINQTTWVYDTSPTSVNFGLLDEEYNNNVKTEYFYDEYLRLETTTTTYIGEDINGTDLVYTQDSYYDQYSRPLANFDATGGSVRYTYNNKGYQVNTIDQVTGVIYQTINDIGAYGNIKETKAGNNVTTINTYDELGRVTNIDTNFFNAPIQYLDYTYDEVGNLKTRKDNRDTNNVFEEIFTYDLLNRLNIVTTSSQDLSNIKTMDITYDEAGRIDIFNDKKYTYESASIHGVSSIYDSMTSETKSFVYDTNGNQTTSAERTLVYNAFNKVEHMHKNNDTTSVKFEYDGNNNRYKRVDMGNDENETTYYVGNVEFVQKANGTLLSKRYIADAVITNDITFGTSTDIIKYLHKDHLGSVQVITNAINPTDNNTQLSYDAWGRRRDMGTSATYIDFNPISDVTKRGFTGQEHVDQLGIINYNARLYDPSLGIMLQADTVIPDGPVTQSMNRYSYVFNNPLSYTDPSGHAPQGFDDPYYDPFLSPFMSPGEIRAGEMEYLRNLYGDESSSGSSATPKGTQKGSFWNRVKNWWNAPAGAAGIQQTALSGANQHKQQIEDAYRAGEISKNERDIHIANINLNLRTIYSFPATKGEVVVVAGEVILTAVGVKASLGKASNKSLSEAADDALNAGKDGAISELKLTDSTTYVELSKTNLTNDIVDGALASVPKALRKPWHGGCAEMACVKRALNDNRNVQGAHIRTLNVGNNIKTGKVHGAEKTTCTSCMNVLDYLGVLYD